MSMRYYLCRKKPSSVRTRHAFLRTQYTWDVEMIMQSKRELLCHYSPDSFFANEAWYFQETTKHEYDLLDAFDVPVIDEYDAEEMKDIRFNRIPA